MKTFTIKHISIKDNKLDIDHTMKLIDDNYAFSEGIGKLFEELAIILTIKRELRESLIEMSKLIAYKLSKNMDKNISSYSLIDLINVQKEEKIKLIDMKKEENIKLFKLMFASALSTKLSDTNYKTYSDIVRNLGYKQYISGHDFTMNLTLFIFESKVLDFQVFKYCDISSLKRD